MSTTHWKLGPVWYSRLPGAHPCPHCDAAAAAAGPTHVAFITAAQSTCPVAGLAEPHASSLQLHGDAVPSMGAEASVALGHRTSEALTAGWTRCVVSSHDAPQHDARLSWVVPDVRELGYYIVSH